MSIVVTGASGTLGRLVAEAVLDRTRDVVLVTRDPSKLDDLAGRGAEIRHGDFSDPDSLASAFAGVTKALIISTDRIGEGSTATRRRSTPPRPPGRAGSPTRRA
jgi:NAD(P)H dehydrogenase (quinone)